MLLLFATAFGIGLIFNAAPGAVFAETVRQGVRGGFKPAFAVQVGSLVGDATWALLGLAGIGLVLQVDALRLPLSIVGAVYLVYLSWDSWKSARTAYTLDGAQPAARTGQALRHGALLSLTNPQNLAYWAAVGSAMGALGVTNPTAGDYAAYFGGFMAASVLWCFVCAALVDRLFRHASATWARFTYRLCAAALLAVALSSLRELWRTGPHDTPKALPRPAATGRP